MLYEFTQFKQLYLKAYTYQRKIVNLTLYSEQNYKFVGCVWYAFIVNNKILSSNLYEYVKEE